MTVSVSTTPTLVNNSTHIPTLPAHQIAALVKSGQLTALEVTEAVLDHIAAVDGAPGALDHITPHTGAPDTAVHAFITLTAERAPAVDERYVVVPEIPHEELE